MLWPKVVACFCLFVAVAGAIESKKRPPKKTPRKARATHVRRYPPPRVAAGVRAASLQKVASGLEQRPDPAIADPAALVPFFERLYRLSHGEDPTVHILHFGDSHTAADEWTGDLRDLFQGRFGNGGAGFSMAGYPFKGYRRLDLHASATGAWHSEGMRTGEGDGFFGLSGVGISTARAGLAIRLEAACDSVELDYLMQPGGGRIALSNDGETVKEASTEGPLGAGFVQFPVAPGRHRLEVRTVDSAPVRLLGWVTQQPKGITYESMGINGAEAGLVLRWDENMHAAYLQRRDPALIVLAYGTNEAGDSRWTEEIYQETFSAILQRLRRAVPAASILVVGPPDRFSRVKGRWRPFAGVGRIIAAQQEACRQNHCSYWNTRVRMGDQGSMLTWVRAGLAQGDYVHFTPQGYQRLAAALFQDIMRSYESYLKVRSGVPTPAPADEQPSQDH